MAYIAHLKIVDNIPCYSNGEKKACKRKIKELMCKYEFDEDCIENINDDFCEGFEVSRSIIFKMLRDDYWKQQKDEKKRN